MDARTGLNANRKIVPPAVEPTPFVMPRGNELLVDNFNRPPADDLDSNQTGISGNAVGMNLKPLNHVHFEGFNPGSLQIVNKRLRMTGAAEDGLQVDVNQSSVASKGGFSIGADITSIVSPNPTDNDYEGLAVGLVGSAAATSASFDTDADFLAELTATGKIRIVVAGVVVDSINVGATSGKLLIAVESPGGFATRAAVTAKVFFNDQPIRTTAFTWRKAGASYTGLTARTGSFAEFDNLVISPLPLENSFVGSYSLSHGLADIDSGPDQDPDGDGENNAAEWLLGTDPKVSDSPLRTALGIGNSGPDNIGLTTSRASAYADSGIGYSILSSEDLATPFPQWTPLPSLNGTVLSRNGQYEQVLLEIPRDKPRKFFILGVGP